MQRLFRTYTNWFGRPRFSRLNGLLFRLGAHGLGLNNFFADGMHLTGEEMLLRSLASLRPDPIVFDVGANKGEWSARLLSLMPAARVYAFEPQTRLAAQIRERLPGIAVFSMALGNRPGCLRLFDYEGGSGSEHATLIEGVIEAVHHGRSAFTEVEVGTIDAVCAAHGVDEIDILKIDTEGYEHSVLAGAGAMLRAGRIHAIQFEFGEPHRVGRTFLADIARELGGHYRILRLLPHGLLPLDAVSPWLREQFVYQNLLAVRREMVFSRDQAGRRYPSDRGAPLSSLARIMPGGMP